MVLKARNQSKKRLVFLICGIVFSAFVALFYYQSQDSRSKKNIENIRTIYTERTENLVNNMFHKTDVLAAVVKLENGNITEDIFDKTAALVYQENSGIRGIQYMPDAVVTYSYPLEGNEAVMGKNFLEIPERREDCLLAINTKSIALSGPYHLIQGGLGLVARNPVFLTDDSGKEYFWGFSTIVLDLPDALTSVGLDHLPESGYDFQLFCVNENNEKIVICGNENLDMDHAVFGMVQVPNHEWTLAITEENPHQKYFGPLIVFTVGIVISLIVWKLYSTIASEHEAIEAKDAFFSNISHDMRTPLNAVLGFTSLAKSDSLTVQQKDDYLNKIETSGRLLLDLINDTLTISKASNGKIVLRPEPCRMDNLGATVLPAVQELAKQKGVQLIIEKLDYRQRTILADRLNSEKIILNLLTNAVKYTPAGGHVWASVHDEPQNAKDADLVFVIRDDGIGMSPEFLKHVYEPFAQENRPGYESTGTGLGLSIVKQMVDLMGGTIQIRSEINKGTEITVRLHYPEVDAEIQPEPCRETSGIDETVLAGKKVLLCEDNAMNREIAIAILQSRGMKVVTATNGEAGVHAFMDSAEHEYDTILMDLRMPVMDGLEASKKIRVSDRADAKTIPIIAMTADVFNETILAAREAGMNEYVTKPIDQDSLFRTLIRYMPSKD